MHIGADNRYEQMSYARCGRSGLMLPRISLGLWQNFGLEKTLEEQKEIIFQSIYFLIHYPKHKQE